MALYDPQPQLSVFARAADALERRGWCQNSIEDDGGRVCLLGAIYRGTLSAERYEDMGPLLGFQSTNEAINWNNAAGRTGVEVVDRLRRGAAGEWASIGYTSPADIKVWS